MKLINNTPEKTGKKPDEIPPINAALTGGNIMELFTKKKVMNNAKNSPTKKITINKKDNLNINAGDEVYLITSNQYEVLNNALLDYETQINKLQSDLKIAIDKSNKNNQDNIHELKEKHQQELTLLHQQQHQEITQLQQDNQQELDRLKEEINQVKKSNNETISNHNEKHHKDIMQLQEKHQQELDQLNNEIKQLQHQQHQDIKEYQESNQKALDNQKALLDEVTQLKAHEFDYAVKYNSLRQSIINISWFDAIRNKHKDLLKEYPVIKLSDNNAAIEVNTSKDNNKG